MHTVLLDLARLSCPAGMGLMMWMMMRGKGNDAGEQPPSAQQVERLRAEVERLKADDAARPATGKR